MEQVVTSVKCILLLGFYGLLGLLVSCNGPTPAKPNKVGDLSDALPKTSASPPSPPATNVAVDQSFTADWDTDPMSAWTVANSLAEFHATWTAYCAQSALGPAGADTLVPYADAVAHMGESWGLATPVPELILVTTEGYAYRYPGGQHGIAPDKENRLPLDEATGKKLGWDELEAGQPFHHEYGGSTFHLLGALRATGRCHDCHDVGEDTLLGAYYYTFHEIADD